PRSHAHKRAISASGRPSPGPGDRAGDYPSPVLDTETIAKVLAEALKRGGDRSEIFVERRSSASWRLEDSRIEDVASGREAGAGIRILHGDQSAYAFTNVLTRAALLEAASAARAALGGSPGARVADLRREPGRDTSVPRPPEEVEPSERAGALRAAD